MIGLIAIELLDRYVIELVHNLAAPLLLRSKVSLLVEVGLADAGLHGVLGVRLRGDAEFGGGLGVLGPHLEVV